MVARSLALDLAPRGIAVSAVMPGYVPTRMTEPFLADAESRAEIIDGIPVGRLRDARRGRRARGVPRLGGGRLHDRRTRHHRRRPKCLTTHCVCAPGRARRERAQRPAGTSDGPHLRSRAARGRASDHRGRREHGDEAIVRALREFDGCEVAVDGAARHAGRDRARAGGDSPSRSCGRSARACPTIRRYKRRRARGRGLAHRARARPRARQAHDADRERRPVRPERQRARSRQCSSRSGTPAVVAGVPEIAVVVPPLPGPSGLVDPAVLVVADELGLADIFPRERPRRRRRARVRHRDDPAGAQGARPPGCPPVQAAHLEHLRDRLRAERERGDAGGAVRAESVPRAPVVRDKEHPRID